MQQHGTIHRISTRVHRALRIAASTAVVWVLSACGGAEKYPQTALDPRSDYAIAIDDLQNLTVYLGFGVTILVMLILAFILVRFRHREGQPPPKQIHGNTQLELAWTLIPAVLVAIIAVPTVQVIFETQAEPPEDALIVDVVGWQWWWEFRYPLENGDTLITANEMHVPVGQPVAVRLHGGDVVHSFWVPQMGGKRDVVPGRVNTIVFTPLEAGTYLGQCAEFCGESHALMKMRLIAHEPEDYERWLANELQPAVEPTDSSLIIGQQLTLTTCAACHTIEGTSASFSRIGPDLTHIGSRQTIAGGIMENNAENMAAWIRNPEAIKPGALMPKLEMSDVELEYIVAYLQSLH